MCEVDGLPVAPNLHTDWSFLPRFEWATIDRSGKAVAILCAVAHWAKQMGGLASETIRLLVVVGSRDGLEAGSAKYRSIVAITANKCTTGVATTLWTGTCRWDEGRQPTALSDCL